MKKFLAIALVAVAIVAFAVAPAFAEGYNDADGSGAGVLGFYTRDAGYFSGPHGGYTTTTNKCQDCHSTHYAAGSFMLLRANSREAACDYCHGGGGGATVNIMMDNDYRSGTFSLANMDAAAIPTTTMGYGTGHTLGYKGNAPVDTQPAYSDDQGFACFDCHTPHGNSARTLQSFGSPSRPAGDGEVTALYGVPFTFAFMYQFQEKMNLRWDGGALMQQADTGKGYKIPYDFRTIDLGDIFGAPMAGNTPFIKWMGAATKIEDVINNKSNIALNTGTLPMGPLDMSDGVDTELDTTMANMGAWQAAGSPPMPALTQTALGTWFSNEMTAGNIVAQADGTFYVNGQAMQDLFSAFPPSLATLMGSWNVYYGEDIKAGNMNTAFLNMGDFQVAGSSYMPMQYPELEVWHKPLFFKGRYLLLKNPDADDDVAGKDYVITNAEYGTEGPSANQKVATDWEFPIGPAASWGPFFSTNNDERFPLQFPWAPTGVAMENEMCGSCHGGAQGQSTQLATVWSSVDNTYITAASHDSNIRGCARAQYLNPNDGDNFGPHCANCHTGSSGCQTCHSETGTNWSFYTRPAYAAYNAATGTYTYTTIPRPGSVETTTNLFVEGLSSYRGVAAVRTSAVSGLNGQCLDGGFSYPHRTLGANMLKDSLYGVDFDGTPISAGATRTANGSTSEAMLSNADIAADLGSWFAGGNSFESTKVVAVGGKKVDNLDSVCIDCHGDATYYNPSAVASFTSYNPLNPTQSWDVRGWSLLLKGLP